jgi:hypothetical protein
MSLKTIDIWSKVGLGFGCALALALFVADLSVWLVNGTGALAAPFDGLAVLAILLTTLGGGGLRIALWLGRRQDQIAATILRAEQPHDLVSPSESEQAEGIGPETLAIARRISARLNA